MKKAFALVVLCFSLVGCNMLTPKQASDAENAGGAIACALERAELNDPALNAACDQLVGKMSPALQDAVARQAASPVRTARAAKPCAVTADAGAP